MTEVELVTLKKDLERQRDEELKECRARWRRRIAAVDDLITNKVQPPGVAATLKGHLVGALEHAAESEHKENNVMKAVRDTLGNGPGTFTVRSLVQLMNKKGFVVTERDVANPLWRLRNEGKIKIVQQGKGRRPHLYMAL